jgi:hypothetical protein
VRCSGKPRAGRPHTGGSGSLPLSVVLTSAVAGLRTWPGVALAPRSLPGEEVSSDDGETLNCCRQWTDDPMAKAASCTRHHLLRGCNTASRPARLAFRRHEVISLGQLTCSK